MRWRIYYYDGTVFDDSMGKPEDAPTVGVICIKQLKQNGVWELVAFADYYLWNKVEWWKADISGFWQHMFSPGFKVVKFGTNVPDEEFEKTMALARKDNLGEGSEI